MGIIKKYTKKGIELTHPSSAVTITTLSSLVEIKRGIQKQIDALEERNTQVNQDILELINVGASQ